MRTQQFNEEVLFADENIVKVDGQDTESLKEQAGYNERERIRLCAHKNVDDELHEMLIVHTKDTYVRPHKHVNKSESFHVIEGEVDIVIFGNQGGILDVIEMGDYVSGKVFYYRLSEPLFHTVLVKSDVVVFHETTNGPFRREDTVFAEWSPEDRNTEAIQHFLANLKNKLSEFARS